MSNITVNLDGIPIEIKRLKIPLKQLILDIENPRIQYYLDTKLNDNITQEKIKFALAEGNEQYEKLKDHIERNGGIYDPIWVVLKENYYTVIEGNTRAFVYEELSEKYVNDEKWKAIDAYVLPYKINRDVINFIRLEKHLFGPTPWDAYEKARELYRLNTQEDYSLKRLEQLTKLSASEIRKNKELKRFVKEGKISLMEFCDWVGEGKFKRGEEIRKLPLVLKDEQSRQALIDDNFQAALDQLEQKNPAAKSKLFEKIEDVIYDIKALPFGELDEIKRGLQPAKIDSLKRLHSVTTNLLKDIGTIKC